jgi:hypothetical protein
VSIFIKRTHSKNFTYLSIAETYRDGGKVKHRIIAPLGREDELKKDLTLERLVSSIMRVSGVELPTPTGQADNLQLPKKKSKEPYMNVNEISFH